MNAPFDPAQVAEAAIHAVETGQGPLILSPAAPLQSARQLIRRRYTQAGGCTVQHHQGVFYVWDATHYRETSRDQIRAIVYEFLDGASRLDGDGKSVPFNPNRAKVSDVFEALAAATQLSDVMCAPTWLDLEQPSCPTEVFACRNGLLHLPTRALLPHTPAFFSHNAVQYPYDPAGWRTDCVARIPPIAMAERCRIH